MKTYPLSLFDAFTEVPFGGSQAAVIDNAADIPFEQRQRIACEIGMPATAFVDACGEDWIEAQFLSTVMELPMCGHGTLCLLTQRLESGHFKGRGEVELRLPKSAARVALASTDDGRHRILLDVAVPEFTPAPPALDELLALLGLDAGALSVASPPETARGDFIHLVLPLSGIDAMRAITPDFGGLVQYCRQHGIETVAAFCRETENPYCHVHVRDFCPAVGVSESAAAGTTNAALSSYLWRQGLVDAEAGTVTVLAEQGLELGRPSSIESRLTLEGSAIRRLQVGGVATRVFTGEIKL